MKQASLFGRVAVLVGAMALFTPALAIDPDYYIGLGDSMLVQMRDDTANQMLMQSINNQVASTAASGSSEAPRRRQPVAARSTVVQVAAAEQGPARLAARYPSAERAQLEKVFVQLLGAYHQLESKFGLQKGDLAGAVAAYLAGSWMAYHNVDFPDANFKPLVEQMRQVIASNPQFAKASPAEAKEMYEQMAIQGMLMATSQMSLKQQPNPQAEANVRRVAKGYLEQFLKADAGKVKMTARGLVIG